MTSISNRERVNEGRSRHMGAIGRDREGAGHVSRKRSSDSTNINGPVAPSPSVTAFHSAQSTALSSSSAQVEPSRPTAPSPDSARPPHSCRSPADPPDWTPCFPMVPRSMSRSPATDDERQEYLQRRSFSNFMEGSDRSVMMPDFSRPPPGYQLPLRLIVDPQLAAGSSGLTNREGEPSQKRMNTGRAGFSQIDGRPGKTWRQRIQELNDLIIENAKERAELQRKHNDEVIDKEKVIKRLTAMVKLKDVFAEKQKQDEAKLRTDWQQEVEAYKAEIRRLKEDRTEGERLSSVQEGLEDGYPQMSAVHLTRINELEKLLEEAGTKITRLECKIEENDNEAIRVEFDYKEAIKNLGWEDQYNDMQKRYQELHREKEQRETRLHNLNKQIRAENAKLNQEIDNLKTEIERNKEKRTSSPPSSAELDCLKQENDKLQMEMERIKKELDEKIEDLKKTEDIFDQMEQESEIKNRKLQELTKRHQNMETLKNQLEQQKKRMETELRKQATAKKQAMDKLEDATSRIKTLEKERGASSNELRSELTKKEVELRQKDDELKRIQAKTASLEATMAKNKEDLDSRIATIEDLEQKWQQERKFQEERQKKMDQEHEELMEKQRQLVNELTKKEEEIATVKMELEAEREKDYGNVDERLIAAEVAVANEKLEKENYKEIVMKLERELAEERKDAQEMIKLMAESREMKQELEKHLKEYEERIGQLAEALKKERRNLEELKREKERVIHEMTMEMETKKTKELEQLTAQAERNLQKVQLRHTQEKAQLDMKKVELEQKLTNLMIAVKNKENETKEEMDKLKREYMELQQIYDTVCEENGRRVADLQETVDGHQRELAAAAELLRKKEAERLHENNANLQGKIKVEQEKVALADQLEAMNRLATKKEDEVKKLMEEVRQLQEQKRNEEKEMAEKVQELQKKEKLSMDLQVTIDKMKKDWELAKKKHGKERAELEKMMQEMTATLMAKQEREIKCKKDFEEFQKSFAKLTKK